MKLKAATVFVLVALLMVAACSGDGSTVEQTPTPTHEPEETQMPSSELALMVDTPDDEAVFEVSEINVGGITIPDAVVSVNGALAGVDAEGSFDVVVNLEPGPNLIEVIASDFYGNVESAFLTVFYATALPLTVLEPANDSVVTASMVTLKGMTNPDAVVTVNDEIVAVDAEGGFSHILELELGPNYIEVSASDFEGHSASVGLTVICTP